MIIGPHQRSLSAARRRRSHPAGGRSRRPARAHVQHEEEDEEDEEQEEDEDEDEENEEQEDEQETEAAAEEAAKEAAKETEGGGGARRSRESSCPCVLCACSVADRVIDCFYLAG